MRARAHMALSAMITICKNNRTEEFKELDGDDDK